MKNDNAGLKNFAVFFIGAAIGAILVILYAPNSGDLSRRKIKYLSKRVEGDAKESIEKINLAAKSFFDNVKNKFDGKRIGV